MTDWLKHWSSVLERVREHDLLGQVAKTVGGEPISPSQLDALVSDITLRLELKSSDRLLDLCCGNGLVTSLCATRCSETMGVDYSAPLIDIVAPRFAGPRLRFLQADVQHLPKEVLNFPASKILMYEGLQFFDLNQARNILNAISRSSLHSAPVLLGSVPNLDRLWQFYDSPERKEDYQRRKLSNTEAIGHWWSQIELENLGSSTGYRVEILAQHPSLHTAHYRFDVLLRPKN